MTSPTHPSPDLGKVDPNVLASIYQSLTTRRVGYEALMWQVPALSLTAQAFLFTIALSADSRPEARLTAATLSFIVAVLSLHLLAKHRFHEELDAKLVEKLERDLALDSTLGFVPHAPPRVRAKAVDMRSNWFLRRSSYHIWFFGLTLFALAALVTAAVAVVSLISPGFVS
jgi:hypothetical protein